VNAAVDVLDSVIDNLAGVVRSEPLIRERVIGIESRARLDVLANLRLQNVLLAGRHDDSANVSARADLIHIVIVDEADAGHMVLIALAPLADSCPTHPA
jgi:hypothetical protein